MIRLNGRTIKIKNFPNGERIFKKEDIYNIKELYANRLEWYYEDDSEIFELMVIKNEIDNVMDTWINLDIKYVPYSRMDRDNDDYVFTLKYLLKFINSLNFNEVNVTEPHSDVTCALLNHVNSKSYTKQHVLDIMDELGLFYDDVVLFFPDAGAQKRYGKMFKIENLVGFKQRDFKTGEIESLEVIGKVDTSKTVIIVDDLCSKGGTFIHSSKKLKELGYNDIYLYVTHCENTIYDGDIFKTDYIKHVFTTDSIFKTYNEQKTDKITVFKI
jgi:ribose-phosphate pyrophosphokinase